MTSKLTLKTILLSLFSILILNSCKKEISSLSNESNDKFETTELTNLEVSFAKILVKALKSDSDLRSFIKEEALKQFDNDYDVLYQLVKNKEISKGETFRGKLLKFTTENELRKIESNLPTLTIFVPTLPNFNPEIWKPVNEVPAVAVANVEAANSVSLYTEGEELQLKSKEVPGFPVLAIKQNERVVIKTNATKQVSSLSAQQGSIEFSFEFIDEAFDGSKNKLAEGKSVDRVAPSPGNLNAVDQVNIDAYNSGVEWHRDYVYYGLTSTNTIGKFRNNYSEFITSFKFLTPNALGIIADQDEDPKPFPNYGTGTMSGGNHRAPGWFDGNFEFRITILINSKNGLGNELVKIISVNPRDLFDLQYRFVRRVNYFFPGMYIDLYEFDTAIPKEFHPNIELLPWDLENYGTAWKFIFYETDNAQEVTNSFENTSTFATNFEISAPSSDKMKVGFKFGASATFTEKRTYSVKTTLASDFLGEATLSFDQPIIIGTSGSNYTTREITTGNILSISVEPKKVF